MNTTELALHAMIKENCFRLLSACFYEPQKGLFQDGNLFRNLTENLKHLCPEAAAFSSDMGKSILKYTEEALRVEYAKLFVGPFELLAPPYGSVYLDEGGRVMGDSTMKVIEAYEKEGLSKDNDFKDLPDHVAVELEFMSYLIYKEREALEKFDAKAAKEYADSQGFFFNNYISTWVPLLCGRMQEGTENEFYRSLAKCLAIFVSRGYT